MPLTHRAIPTTATVLAFVMVAGACGDSGSDASTPDSVVACSSLAGQPTVDIDEFFDQGNACGIDTGQGGLVPAFLGISDLECADASFLYWNDIGWGAVPGTWVLSDRRSPPRDLLAACRGD